ncbi:hypothetical protein DCS_01365 [Drechmeria coniospora]|uniref:Uncharacterized protein n=1 Tax=Drechmeria coniospora TaxID=98403 RepID=A0A151GT23_DRECN|nr:hypothetical protein DCS_01365 [Drechmeria coniospora]KYK60228.1 hypothetical protein DCS_01365 [Drechmeria coniospora]ODA80169.1 hypothetical protein RJ55_03127 [Drechmeria coniospora]
MTDTFLRPTSFSPVHEYCSIASLLLAPDIEPRNPAGLRGPVVSTFNSAELLPPPPLPLQRRRSIRDMTPPNPAGPVHEQGHSPTPVKMQRQDSGYESRNASPRTSTSQAPLSPPRRSSDPISPSHAAASPLRPRPRCPSSRRSAQSYPQLRNQLRRSAGSYQAGPHQLPTSPSLIELISDVPKHDDDVEVIPLPPPTTHYWTSDNTRRLEYAAIDAASRGVKGWVRRHLVPDCFIPRHVAFDDDKGSVRRYRLELEDEQVKKPPSACQGLDPRRKGWQIWPLRKSRTA